MTGSPINSVERAGMYLDQSQVAAPQQSLNISAKLITSIKILQLSAEELEMAISEELRANPALEIEELSQCLRCGAPLQDGVCANCDTPEGANHSDNLANEDYLGDRDLAVPNDEEEFDPLARIEAPATLGESLLINLCAVLAPEDFVIAEYLVGSLDSHGYVQVSVEEVAEVLRVDVARVEHVLSALQAQEPAGIGARDLRECLLIQLRSFRERSRWHNLAEVLISSYLTELGERHFPEIARAIGVSQSQVRDAWRFIKTNLNPFPAHAYAPSLGGSTQTTLVRPDVVIRRTAHGFEAEVVEGKKYLFWLNPTYRRLAAQLDPKKYSEEERQHIRQYTQRAQFFIDCIHQRWETLKKISDALVEYQYEFLEKGVRYLRPLTRGELAERVGLHESTISRATANKFVLLPEGRTVSFDDFFDASLRTKDTLRELIASENPRNPFSDEELATLLAERGLPVARRTVAKYRESMHILPSRLRT
jgi:RNA polymerase sigma-54 factor